MKTMFQANSFHNLRLQLLQTFPLHKMMNKTMNLLR
jgi:hypothetical protein